MIFGFWFVVGLGNPGPTYAHSRHNVGFWAIDVLAERLGASFALASRHSAAVTTATLPASPGVDAIKLVLAKPTTYMNESGRAVRSVAAFHKIDPSHIIAIHDELDLDPGRLRVKHGGGDNGHNGLKSMRAHLGTGDFTRVRVGIGRPDGRQPAADWVLAKLKPSDAEAMRVDAAVAADAVESFVRNGLDTTQNMFNK